MSEFILALSNGQSRPLHDLPLTDGKRFRDQVLSLIAEGSRIAAWFGIPGPGATGLRMTIALARDVAGDYALLSTAVGDSYPSLTPECPQAQLFEREFFERWNVRPVGHPWLKPVRFPRSGCEAPMEFYKVDGDDIHEVAVGPVHAGVIEPGHFRFNCEGETVHHLEISLGYQHRGVERAIIEGAPERRIHYVETAAGDTTVGHTLAYAQLLEALSGIRVSARAERIRGIALELERLANHTGDMGALAGDVGFLPTASFCGRLRGEFLNLTALLCGNRFGRGLVRPGAVPFDIDEKRVGELLKRIDPVFADTAHAVELLWNTPSVMARFERTGTLCARTAIELGLVGVTARACGLERDVRLNHPHGVYAHAHLPASVADTGDVFARAYVRWLEMQRSFAFVKEVAQRLGTDDTVTEKIRPAPEHIAISAVEAWRGEAVHVAVTDTAGRLSAYKIVDPSFHNWQGLAMAMRGEEISDFPLCNKSFNLSYCGHDL